MNLQYFQAGLVVLICAAIGAICICRLDKIDKSVLLRVGWQYILMLMAAALLAAAPLKWVFPGWETVLFAAAVLVMLYLDSYQWIHGPPPSSRLGKLEEEIKDAPIPNPPSMGSRLNGLWRRNVDRCKMVASFLRTAAGRCLERWRKRAR